MSEPPSQQPRFALPLQRVRWLDWLLLIPALLAVLVDDLLWDSAKRLVARFTGLARLRLMLARLPAWAALTLFLIPETASHLGSLAAAALLVRRGFVPAGICYVVTKLTATVLAVWIYQSCEPVLLGVRWFAWLHARVFALRDWGLQRMAPMRGAMACNRSRIIPRFRALRLSLALRLARRR